MYNDTTHVLDHLKVSSVPNALTHTVFIDENIEEEVYYRSVILALANASENDVFHFRISTNGGFGTTAMSLAHAMDTCPAHKVGILAGNVKSAGTIIALHCDSWEVGEGCDWLAHTASFGVGGEAHKVAKQHEHDQRLIRNLLFREYEGFYSKEEIEDIAAGTDSLLLAEEVTERLQSFAEFRNKKATEEVNLEIEAQLEEEDLYVEAVLSVAKNKGLLSEEEVKLSRKIEDVLEKVIEECKEEVEDLLKNPAPVSEDPKEEIVLGKETFPAKEIPCVRITDEEGNVTAIISYEEEDSNIVNIELEEYSSGEVYNISNLEHELKYYDKDFRLLFDVLGLAFPKGTSYPMISDTVKQTVIDLIKGSNSKN